LSGIDRVQVEDMLLLAVGSGRSDFRLPMAQRTIGEVGRDDALGTLYAAADIVVIPSRQDNLPNTMVEAMACGTPVIGFAVGGIPDLVRHDETGLLAPPGDVAGLRNAIETLLADSDRRQRMGKSCRDLILKECHPRVQASRYLDLFAGLAQREVAGRRRAG
jgi:glycosyltransferase involved in cell wall biosynthesis